MLRSVPCWVVLVLLPLPGVRGQGAGDETRRAEPGQAPPRASLADLGWLEGSWEGEGIRGGKALEAYSAAAGGQMVGHFRQLNPDGTVFFYELMTIVEEAGTLRYRLKHFDGDLKGWEDAKVAQDFPLIAVGPDAWHFDGLTIKKDGPDGMSGIVRIQSKDGKARELAIHYRRKK